MTIDSVGSSNTSGYSFTGGDPVETGAIVGIGNGITAYTPMTGGGKLRRKMTKRLKQISKQKMQVHGESLNLLPNVGKINSK